MGLLDVKLVIELVTGIFSQLKSLSIETILGPEIGKTIWPG